MDALITRLQVAAQHLTGDNHDKATSLVAFYERKGYLTTGQEKLAGFLLQRAQTAPAARAASFDLTNITAMFDLAKRNGLKRPRLYFRDPHGRRFIVSAASATSRNPGWLYVKAGDDYLGKISPEGNFTSSAIGEGAQAQAALVAFNRDPVASAKVFARETGQCMFCGLELTDERSVTVSYGPICASRWGLPWGAK